MKIKFFLLFFTILLNTGLFAQESITNIVVTPKTDGTGILDVYYDLSGTGSEYNISLEASFDAGSTYIPVPTDFLSGDLSSIAPGSNKQIIWDGQGSFPDTYSTQALLKIIAVENTGGNGQPCPGAPTVTDIDGNTYNTVLIGEQCWMAENLNTTKDAAGSTITRYCYDNNTTNCGLYGGLYQWATVMNGEASSSGNPSGVQGICPNGWHLPSDAEWTELLYYMISQGYPNVSNDPNGISNALKSCRQVSSPLGGNCNTTVHPRWNAYDTHYGTDVFGFSSLPGGYRNSAGAFAVIGNTGYWWSATQVSSASAWYRLMVYFNSSVGKGSNYKTSGFSVRCLKD